jgi:hypothetical protein
MLVTRATAPAELVLPAVGTAGRLEFCYFCCDFT